MVCAWVFWRLVLVCHVWFMLLQDLLGFIVERAAWLLSGHSRSDVVDVSQVLCSAPQHLSESSFIALVALPTQLPIMGESHEFLKCFLLGLSTCSQHPAAMMATHRNSTQVDVSIHAGDEQDKECTISGLFAAFGQKDKV